MQYHARFMSYLDININDLIEACRVEHTLFHGVQSIDPIELALDARLGDGNQSRA